MELKLKQRTIVEVQCLDLRDFIKEHYGKAWNVQQMWEMHNGTRLEYTIHGSDIDYQSVGDDERFAEWLAAPYPCSDECFETSGYSPGTSWGMTLHWERNTKHFTPPETILSDLCRKEIIPPGEYVIRVEW